jgi:hypothetical protein
MLKVAVTVAVVADAALRTKPFCEWLSGLSDLRACNCLKMEFKRNRGTNTGMSSCYPRVSGKNEGESPKRRPW